MTKKPEWNWKEEFRKAYGKDFMPLLPFIECAAQYEYERGVRECIEKAIATLESDLENSKASRETQFMGVGLTIAINVLKSLQHE